MTKLARYLVEYEFNGKAWGLELYADSWEEAQRKLKAAGKGKVIGSTWAEAELSSLKQGPKLKAFQWGLGLAIAILVVAYYAFLLIPQYNGCMVRYDDFSLCVRMLFR